MRKKGSAYELEGRGEGIGRRRERENYIQDILCEKHYFQYKKKNINYKKTNRLGHCVCQCAYSRVSKEKRRGALWRGCGIRRTQLPSLSQQLDYFSELSTTFFSFSSSESKES